MVSLCKLILIISCEFLNMSECMSKCANDAVLHFIYFLFCQFNLKLQYLQKSLVLLDSNHDKYGFGVFIFSILIHFVVIVLVAGHVFFSCFFL